MYKTFEEGYEFDLGDKVWWTDGGDYGEGHIVGYEINDITGEISYNSPIIEKWFNKDYLDEIEYCYPGIDNLKPISTKPDENSKIMDQ